MVQNLLALAALALATGARAAMPNSDCFARISRYAQANEIYATGIRVRILADEACAPKAYLPWELKRARLRIERPGQAPLSFAADEGLALRQGSRAVIGRVTVDFARGVITSPDGLYISLRSADSASSARAGVN
jgi:hypothetical protein